MKRYLCLWMVLLGSTISTPSRAATIDWVGGGADDNWSTGANWNPADSDPTGDDLYYDATGMTTLGTVNGVVDSNYTVASMRFENLSTTATQGHTIEIPSGTTLTVSDTVDIGFHWVSPWGDPNNVNNNKYVTAMFTGGGEMVVNGGLIVESSGSGSPKRAAKLDATGLSRFEVDTTGSIRLGGRNDGRGELILSPDNLLRAANIYVGAGSHSWATVGSMSSLHLGQQNTLNANTISVGGYGLAGEMLFQSSLVGPEVIIRDRAGTGPANLYIGDMHGADRDVSGVVDFTGGSVDAELDQLQVGIVDLRDAVTDRSAGSVGTLSMSAGTINANVVILGRAVDGTFNANRHWADGTLNLQGGEFTAGTITLALDEAPAHGRVRGTVNFSGGTLSAGTIQKGLNGAEAIFNWTGGTLHVDSFGFQLDQAGGVLAPGASVGQTDILADYNQAAAGVLQIEIEGTGTPGVDYDLVTVAGNATLLGILKVLIDPGYDPQVGDFFDVLTATGSIDAANLTLTGDSPGAHGWTVTVLGDSGGGHILRLTAVPEPSGLLLLAVGLLGLGFAVRRKRKRVT